MDPLSITAATAGTTDVIVRLVRYLRKTIDGARGIDKELQQLLSQVERLRSVNNGIATITRAPDFVEQWRKSFENPGSLTKSWEHLWLDTRKFLTEAENLLTELEGVLKDIQRADQKNTQNGIVKEGFEAESQTLLQKPPPSKSFRAVKQSAGQKIDRLAMQLRKDSRSDDLNDISNHLDQILQALDICLSMINLGWNVRSHQLTTELLNQSKDAFTNEMRKLQQLVLLLRPSKSPVREPESNNIYQAPAASDLFTGRTALLHHVEEAFGISSASSGDENPPLSASSTLVDPASSTSEPAVEQPCASCEMAGHHFGLSQEERKQKRFVLVGLGGSGKTEFCRKFAERNQSSFWGVFWIDATSDETAQHSYKAIAQLGGVAENIKAAMTWLASLIHSWLLIIDNVDNPDMDLENYLPGGDRGHVLLTTRLPALRRWGNSGNGFFELEKLEAGEARELLLKHAQERRPWADYTTSKANTITSNLGFLPLALVYAGKVIAEGVTTLSDYIAWFEESWDKLRTESRRSGRMVEDSGKNIFAPYDAILQTLGRENSQSAQDAIDLLKMIAFMHNEDITFEMLVKAANNSREVESQERQRWDEKEQAEIARRGVKVTAAPKPWRRKTRDMLVQAVIWYGERTSHPVLPRVLRHSAGSPFSIHDLRAAMSRLTQKSLVSERLQNGQKVYSMHPLIHKWVRERPQMSLGERALWCQAAATVLTQCIPLPPLASTKSDALFRRQLLVHTDAVRKHQAEIESHLHHNRATRMFRSLLLPSTVSIDPFTASQYARFSRLYLECSRFSDAEQLLVQVKDYSFKMLGVDDDRTIAVMLALAGTYWALTRTRDAVALQNKALETAHRTLGPRHPRTLKIMDMLGKSEAICGRFKEARKLHEDAIEGMQRVLPADHEDLFMALDNLGNVWYRYFDYSKAMKLHEEAVEGLTRALGSDHVDTLMAKENLATTWLEKAVDWTEKLGHIPFSAEDHQYLLKAELLETEVLQARRRILGREDNWTLWSACLFGRIQSALGRHTEAETEIRVALAAGIRNVGETHIAVLTATGHLARVLVAQRRYDEAEQIFKDITNKSLYEKGSRSEGESPAQLLNIWYYAGCCELNGHPRKSIELLEGISPGLTTIGATRHPFWERVLAKLKELRQQVASQESESQARPDTLSANTEALRTADCGKDNFVLS